MGSDALVTDKAEPQCNETAVGGNPIIESCFRREVARGDPLPNTISGGTVECLLDFTVKRCPQQNTVVPPRMAPPSTTRSCPWINDARSLVRARVIILPPDRSASGP